MDKYSDHLFSSSSWDVKEKSCWGYSETGQPNVLLPTSLRLHEIDKGNLSLSMINSKQSVECLPTQDTSSIVLDHESNYAADNGFISGEAQSLEEVQNRNYNVSPLLNGGIKMENMGLQYNTAFSTGPTPHSLNLNYSKQLPVVDPSTSTFSFTEASHVECNSSKNLEYHRSFKDMQNLAPLPKFWPSASYEGVSSLSAVIGQDTTQQFDLHEGNLEDDMDFMGKRYASIDQILQLDKLSASVASKDKENLQSYPSSSFKAGSNVTLAANGVPFLPQNTLSPPAGCCNGTAKPRVRARRGQATDPHSIAERLRREKIAERIKNLQELVPNSSKVDKTSILDEIIEYVKFLQLQVKVLSMSRLGAAGAVLPLITDGQAEGSNSLSLSPSAGLAIDTAPSPDQIAFEQEVLKLMESNMTAAVQYLQSKGLCLMPIALATAISSGKASFSPSGSDEKKKISFTNDLANSNNGGSHSSSSSGSCNFSGIETCQMSSDYNIKPEELSSKGIGNGFNGILKLEDVKNQFSRKLKPKTVI